MISQKTLGSHLSCRSRVKHPRASHPDRARSAKGERKSRWRLSVISPTNHDQLSLVHTSTVAFASLAVVICPLEFAILLACGGLFFFPHSPAAQGWSTTRNSGARSFFFIIRGIVLVLYRWKISEDMPTVTGYQDL